MDIVTGLTLLSWYLHPTSTTSIVFPSLHLPEPSMCRTDSTESSAIDFVLCTHCSPRHVTSDSHYATFTLKPMSALLFRTTRQCTATGQRRQSSLCTRK
ncbi:hypothetical protein BJ170DRAFT_73907 [Xylariales sp. AK1849]|nr:hypothetical protein BJ170DRAFT_73907 [Xylariales sp. AK1849]